MAILGTFFCNFVACVGLHGKFTTGERFSGPAKFVVWHDSGLIDHCPGDYAPGKRLREPERCSHQLAGRQQAQKARDLEKYHSRPLRRYRQNQLKITES